VATKLHEPSGSYDRYALARRHLLRAPVSDFTLSLGLEFLLGDKAELLCFVIPQRLAHVCICVCNWIARKLVANCLVGLSRGKYLPPHQIPSH
jgi:hypothetical protein